MEGMAMDGMGGELPAGPPHHGFPTKIYNGVMLQYWQEGGIGHPIHGARLGHYLPGWFFVFWGSWWILSVFRLHFKSSAKTPFASRGWFEWPTWVPGNLPLEPIAKVVMPFIGILGELWLGHDAYQPLYLDGKFNEHQLQDWQHSAMYLAYLISGLVDLVGYYTPYLPSGTEQAYLGMAFVVEGTLLAFHLKGTMLDFALHLLLVLTIFTTAIVIFAEMSHPHNMLLAALRGSLVFLQGVWFIQIGNILYNEHPEWDPTYMGSSMIVPVFFCFCALMVTFGVLTAFVLAKAYQQWSLKTYRPVKLEEPSWQQPPGKTLARRADAEITDLDP
ncbi:hypothetical protein WJX72_001620 [[Myrmecia] bisecta]|uniref:Transmembrane protein 45B n=1 Tax=[Myrmecia] bisecta TaxID=41462 RepID=A0AAW1PFE2_9CHLO